MTERPVRIEPSGKRVRVVFGGDVIADTDDTLYVWERAPYPQYYLPRAAVRAGVLTPSGSTEVTPLGVAIRHTVSNGVRAAVDAAWTFPDSPIVELRDRVRFDWAAMDAWFEEDEEVFVHPRDPSTRVQILPTSRHAAVRIDGIVVAESNHPSFLYETGLPRRTYFPKLDVRADLLTPTATTTMCPYKGTARYWSVWTPSGVHEDVAWSYPTPLRESALIAGLVAFYDDRVDLTVDGIPRDARGAPR
jgi:uncharacterized protein (DUF427 family)